MAGVALSQLELRDVSGALSVLRLRGTNLAQCSGSSAAAAKALGELVARAPLEAVDLKNCHLTDAAAKAFAAELRCAPCLAYLNLSRHIVLVTYYI